MLFNIYIYIYSSNFNYVNFVHFYNVLCNIPLKKKSQNEKNIKLLTANTLWILIISCFSFQNYNRICVFFHCNFLPDPIFIICARGKKFFFCHIRYTYIHTHPNTIFRFSIQKIFYVHRWTEKINKNKNIFNCLINQAPHIKTNLYGI